MYSGYIMPLLLILAFCTAISFAYVKIGVRNDNDGVSSIVYKNQHTADNYDNTDDDDDNAHLERLSHLERQLSEERKHNDDTDARLKTIVKELDAEREKHKRVLLDKESEREVDKSRLEYLESQLNVWNREKTKRENELKLLKDSLEAEKKAHEQQLIDRETQFRRKQEELRQQQELQKQQELQRQQDSKRADELRRQQEVRRADEIRRHREITRADEIRRQQEITRADEIRRQEEEVRRADELLRQQEITRAQELQRQRELIAKRDEESRRQHQPQQPTPPQPHRPQQIPSQSIHGPQPNGEQTVPSAATPPVAETSNAAVTNEVPIDKRFVKHTELQHDKNWIDVSKLTVVMTQKIGDAIAASVGAKDIANRYCLMKIPESALPPGSSTERKLKKSLQVGENKDGEPKRFARMKIIMTPDTTPTMIFHDYTPVVLHKVFYDFERDTVSDREGCSWQEFDVNAVHIGTEKLAKISKISMLLKPAAVKKEPDNKNKRSKKPNKKSKGKK